MTEPLDKCLLDFLETNRPGLVAEVNHSGYEELHEGYATHDMGKLLCWSYRFGDFKKDYQLLRKEAGCG